MGGKMKTNKMWLVALLVGIGAIVVGFGLGWNVWINQSLRSAQ